MTSPSFCPQRRIDNLTRLYWWCLLGGKVAVPSTRMQLPQVDLIPPFLQNRPWKIRVQHLLEVLRCWGGKQHLDTPTLIKFPAPAPVCT
jgi:hypothetical protein